MSMRQACVPLGVHGNESTELSDNSPSWVLPGKSGFPPPVFIERWNDVLSGKDGVGSAQSLTLPKKTVKSSRRPIGWSIGSNV